jgi:hypothetical protein
VANIEPVAVINAAYYLLEVVECFVFGKSTATDQIFEQLSTLYVLHDQVSANEERD